ncbi:MAG TPA: methyltransferase domain-containing protein, partial [Bacteroidia bacterium]|nr:methyltransferase domain-containing protein [Bacteroidia bacterium]
MVTSAEAISQLEYFENIAKRRNGKRRKHSYYWKDITYFCNYFAQEDISILEIGCGTGELIGEIKGKRKVGIDFSPGMLDIARKQYPSVDFICMEAENIALNEKFDLIIISNVIGCLEDIEKVLEGLHKVSHARTKIIITYYNYLWEPFIKLAEFLKLKTPTYDQNWLAMKDINNLLYLSGFDTYRNVRRMLCPVNIPLIAPLFNRYIAKLPLFRHLCINQFCFAAPFANNRKEEYDKKYSVSVVIPARNESGNIENAIIRMPMLGKHTEIIFIEGNSTDDTWDKIQEIQRKYSSTHDIKIDRQKGKGKGDAVRLGFD